MKRRKDGSWGLTRQCEKVAAGGDAGRSWDHYEYDLAAAELLTL